MFEDLTFAFPFAFLLLILIPAILFWYWKQNKKISPDLVYSSFEIFKGIKPTLKNRLKHLPIILRCLALILLIIALARPQSFLTGEDVNVEGIDIVMLLDISGSMLAEDFKPNRLEAAKQVTDDFIAGRTSDRIGLVIFSAESFTQCPLTIDYSVLRGLLKEIKSGMIEDGTAIGSAIANGVNRLKDSNAKSKVMILLTDGVNNRGEIDPITAAQIAAKFGIRIYAVGVGTIGEAPYPFQTPFGIRYQNVPVEIDEPVLKEIAKITNGKYFRATGNKKLQDIYAEIDKLEKTQIQVTSFRKASELFYGFAALGLLLLILEFILSKIYLRKLP